MFNNNANKRMRYVHYLISLLITLIILTPFVPVQAFNEYQIAFNGGFEAGLV
jgi:hypothetical protein